MIQILRCLIISACLIAVTTINPSQAKARPSSKQIENYMSVAGINHSVNQLSNKFERLLKASAPKDIYFNSKLKRTIPWTEQIKNYKHDWKQNKAKNLIAKNIKKNISEDDLEKLIQWYESEPFLEFQSASNVAIDANFERKAIKYFASLKNDPPTKSHIIAMEQIIKHMNKNDHALYYGIIKSSLKQSIDKEVKRLSGNLSRSLVSEVEGQLQSDSRKHFMTPNQSQVRFMTENAPRKIKKLSKVNAFYMYRNLSEKQIKDIAKFYKTKLGQKDRQLKIHAIKIASDIYGSGLNAPYPLCPKTMAHLRPH